MGYTSGRVASLQGLFPVKGDFGTTAQGYLVSRLSFVYYPKCMFFNTKILISKSMGCVAFPNPPICFQDGFLKKKRTQRWKHIGCATPLLYRSKMYIFLKQLFKSRVDLRSQTPHHNHQKQMRQPAQKQMRQPA